MRVPALLAAMVAVASANGRAPVTGSIATRPGDPHSLYVGTTFGLAISHDDGCTFRWVCEQAVGYTGTFDPTYMVGADGTIYATTYDGLQVSRDGGCSFATATAALASGDPGRIAGIYLAAIDIGPADEVWVASADNGKTNDVFRSTDHGATFTGQHLASPTILWASVKVAPSNPMRVYATGYELATGTVDGGQGSSVAHIERSDDGGAHWTELPHAGFQLGSPAILRVMAVDRTNADLVYLASVGASSTGDRLYRSSDGGMTFGDVLETDAPVHDVVVVDAQHVVVATQFITAGGNLPGAGWASSDGGHTFGQLPPSGDGMPRKLACAALAADGSLVGCGANWAPDQMAVGRSTNRAMSWSKVWRFVELAGTLSCPGGTAEHDTCDMLWSCPTCMTDLKSMFAATGPTCGPDVQHDAAVPPHHGGGCCDAGDATAVWPIAIALFALRRRSRPW